MHVPVLIVGAGPVGLALAGDLAWRGVETLLVERTSGDIYQPKMDLVGIRSMEFCRRWGIADWVRDSPYPRDYPQDYVYVTSLTGYELGREVMPSKDDEPIPPQSPQKRERCPQDMFDPILRRWVESLGKADLMLNTTLTELVEKDDVVAATLTDARTGDQRTVTAEYAIGADGAGSNVRQILGIEMQGRSALTYTNNAIFRCPDLVSMHDKGKAYRFIFIGPEGTWGTIVAINGGDRWRFSFVGTSEPRIMTEDDVRAAIIRAMGKDFDFEILSIVPWVRRELVAESYGRGRVFIVGDAAHVMSPTGGFGMNTGIQDAVDLGWKLEAMLSGWGGTNLLPSYEIERRPVAQRNVQEASGNLTRMLSPRTIAPPVDLLDPGPEADRHRREFGDEYAARMKREWYTIGIHLGYHYEGSPIIVSDGTPPPEPEVMTYTPTARPGSRAPHAWLADGRSTLDLYGRGYVLLRLGDAPPDATPLAAAAASRGVPLTEQRLHERDVADLYGCRLVLVRPDGHVAWRSDHLHDDVGRLIDRVRGM
jgi:2-polyprenyl-6-methoxyphenol hydroxylase-like FAD-dependent oxidoreductase